MLEMVKKSNVVMVTLVNNGQTKLKIKFTPCYFSMLKMFFYFIWLFFEGLNMVKPQFLAIPNMYVKCQFEYFKFSCQNCQFPKGLTYEN